ncbi:homeodomain-like protein [Tanacetum coccineum]
MTRSSTNKLFMPFKEPEREFQSSRKHFKTLSLDESRSPNFNLFSYQEEYSEEEVAETMEVVLFFNGLDIPTRQILDSRGVIPSKTAEDVKTFDELAAIQAQLNNLGREIKKVNEKVYAAQVGCEQCKGPHYTKDCPLKEEGKTLEEAYYTQFGASFQGGGYRVAAPGFYQRNNANPSYQERRQSMEETLRNLWGNWQR